MSEQKRNLGPDVHAIAHQTLVDAHASWNNGGLSLDLIERATAYGPRHSLLARISNLGQSIDVTVPMFAACAPVLREIADMLEARAQDPKYMSPIKFTLDSPVPGANVRTYEDVYGPCIEGSASVEDDHDGSTQ